MSNLQQAAAQQDVEEIALFAGKPHALERGIWPPAGTIFIGPTNSRAHSGTGWRSPGVVPDVAVEYPMIA